jgi:hypothetical protein
MSSGKPLFEVRDATETERVMLREAISTISQIDSGETSDIGNNAAQVCADLLSGKGEVRRAALCKLGWYRQAGAPSWSCFIDHGVIDRVLPMIFAVDPFTASMAACVVDSLAAAHPGAFVAAGGLDVINAYLATETRPNHDLVVYSVLSALTSLASVGDDAGEAPEDTPSGAAAAADAAAGRTPAPALDAGVYLARLRKERLDRTLRRRLQDRVGFTVGSLSQFATLFSRLRDASGVAPPDNGLTRETSDADFVFALLPIISALVAVDFALLRTGESHGVRPPERECRALHVAVLEMVLHMFSGANPSVFIMFDEAGLLSYVAASAAFSPTLPSALQRQQSSGSTSDASATGAASSAATAAAEIEAGRTIALNIIAQLLQAQPAQVEALVAKGALAIITSFVRPDAPADQVKTALWSLATLCVTSEKLALRLADANVLPTAARLLAHDSEAVRAEAATLVQSLLRQDRQGALVLARTLEALDAEEQLQRQMGAMQLQPQQLLTRASSTGSRHGGAGASAKAAAAATGAGADNGSSGSSGGGSGSGGGASGELSAEDITALIAKHRHKAGSFLESLVVAADFLTDESLAFLAEACAFVVQAVPALGAGFAATQLGVFETRQGANAVDLALKSSVAMLAQACHKAGSG